ncbi:DUF4440 domain-containing protein [Sanguibacter gelidistatuariae]|nr:DUF4440 domain-containing protein [Sanguibacter gelidistatuariae]
MAERGYVDLAAMLRVAEVALLTPATRQDPERIRALLHPDYVEVGRSGRRWTRDDVLDRLACEQARPTPATDEWELMELAPDLVLVTYRMRGDQRESRHSSIWDISSGSPVLRFHQGTVVPSTG